LGIVVRTETNIHRGGIMLIALLVVIIGLVTLLSGVFEQNYFTIAIGVVLMLGAWLSFYLSWRKQAKAGQINHDKN
jgi:disulfide bond formation protein DsbB